MITLRTLARATQCSYRELVALGDTEALAYKILIHEACTECASAMPDAHGRQEVVANRNRVLRESIQEALGL